jgi:hypothetical protein
MTYSQKLHKIRQVRTMNQILSLEGPLLTKEQKEDVIQITRETNIIDGFERIDYWKLWNKQIKSVPPTSPKS